MNDLPQEMQMPQPQLTGVGDVNSIPGEPMSQEFVGDNEKQVLASMIEEIRNKLSELNSAQFSTGNISEVEKSKALQEIFTILQSNGVDLSDPTSVQDFIERMRESNPELAQFFEQVMEQLLGEPEQLEDSEEMMEGENPFGVMPQNTQNMNNQNETLPETVRGPIPQ